MQGFVERGDAWLKPLLEFRDWLAKIRNEANYRQPQRRDGTRGLGPFTLKTRREIYRRLIQAEELVRKTKEGKNIRLIGATEKRIIENLWREDGSRGCGIAELEMKTRKAVAKNRIENAI